MVFTQKECAEMKTFGAPGMHLMGFKPASRLKLSYNVKNTKLLRPDEKIIEGSTTMFNALLLRLQVSTLSVRRKTGAQPLCKCRT